MIKKLLMYSLVGLIGLCGSLVSANEYAFPYADTQIQGEDTTDIGQALKDTALGEDSTSERLQRTFNVAWDSEGDQRATDYVRVIINWFLAVVGLVALAVLIIAFYRMLVSTESEERWGDARKTVINAAIALALIGVAWFIVSWFFEIFFVVSDGI